MINKFPTCNISIRAVELVQIFLHCHFVFLTGPVSQSSMGFQFIRFTLAVTDGKFVPVTTPFIYINTKLCNKVKVKM